MSKVTKWAMICGAVLAAIAVSALALLLWLCWSNKGDLPIIRHVVGGREGQEPDKILGFDRQTYEYWLQQVSHGVEMAKSLCSTAQEDDKPQMGKAETWNYMLKHYEKALQLLETRRVSQVPYLYDAFVSVGNGFLKLRWLELDNDVRGFKVGLNEDEEGKFEVVTCDLPAPIFRAEFSKHWGDQPVKELRTFVVLAKSKNEMEQPQQWYAWLRIEFGDDFNVSEYPPIEFEVPDSGQNALIWLYDRAGNESNKIRLRLMGREDNVSANAK